MREVIIMAFWFGSSSRSTEASASAPSRTTEHPTPSLPSVRIGESESRASGYAIGLAAPGARVCVTALKGAVPSLEKRLEAMGIRVGTALEVLQHEGGSVIVRIGTTRLALGASMAHRLHVEPLGLH